MSLVGVPVPGRVEGVPPGYRWIPDHPNLDSLYPADTTQDQILIRHYVCSGNMFRDLKG